MTALSLVLGSDTGVSQYGVSPTTDTSGDGSGRYPING
jgi:hypothetical protein